MALTALEKYLKVSFKNKALLAQALMHSSYASENGNGLAASNERLEFLGDAVLELVSSEFLYHQFPGEPEGTLTNWRSILVNSRQLAAVARALRLNEFVKLSRGETKSEGALKESIMANTFEAVLGALYLDQGYKATKKFIDRVLLSRLDEILAAARSYNPKGFFQEEAQKRLGITPTYEVLEESGPDHEKHFVVGAYIDTELIAKGDGPSKQEAQQAAAKNAISAKGWAVR